MKRAGGIAIFLLILMISVSMVFLPNIGGDIAYAEGEESEYLVYRAKAYGKKVGGYVNIYALPSADSEVIATCFDGTSLVVTESEVEGYHIVIMDEGQGYVKDENLTTSLSYNQRIALIIAIICAVTVLLILLITYYRRNSDYFKSKRMKE